MSAEDRKHGPTSPETEPLRVKGASSVILGAILAMIVGVFGLDLSWEKAAAVVALAALSSIGGLEWARGTFTRTGRGVTWAPESVREVAAGLKPPPEEKYRHPGDGESASAPGLYATDNGNDEDDWL